MSTSEFHIYGHRGSPRRALENTLDSIRLAIDEGADGVEVDLRRLADGTAVLYHDDTAGTRRVEDMAADELQSLVRAVPEVASLRSLSGSTRMILEVKRSGWERELARIIEEWDRIVVSSFDHRVLVALRDAGFGGATGIVYDGYIVGAAEYAKGIGATWIFPRHPYVDVPLISSARAFGMPVIPWTVNRPEDWARMRELGCNGMITDLPSEAVAWRGA